MIITLSVDTGFIIVWYDPATLLDPKYSLVRRLQTVSCNCVKIVIDPKALGKKVPMRDNNYRAKS